MIAKKSLKKNMFLYAIKNIVAIVFPLVTYPYISRILGVEQIGKNDYARSIISYFLLIASMGISTYAVREGGRKREDKYESQIFYSEIFTINILSTLVAYLSLVIAILIFEELRQNLILLVIYSVQIILTTIGKEWILTIYEDFYYITIRTIAFQLLSLILLFSLVNDRGDVEVYAVVLMISACGSQIVNFFYSRKYAHVSLRFNWEQLRKHIIPILTIFGMSATIVIYVSSDITILGIMSGNYSVGLYSTATKIYSIVKTFLSSVLIVTIPRFSTLIGKKDTNGVEKLAKEVLATLMTLLIPIIIGLIIERKDIVSTIASKEFESASSSLAILGVALFFCMGAWFWGQCILIPYGRENAVLKITVISAVANVLLNFVFIPFWNENAAALTTVFAEGLCFIYCRAIGKKYVTISDENSIIIKTIIGSVPIFFISKLAKAIISECAIRLVLVVVSSAVAYLIIEVFLQNQVVYGEYMKVVKKLKCLINKNNNKEIDV